MRDVAVHKIAVKCDGNLIFFFCFFFNDTATTEIYTLSLHDALPICFISDLNHKLELICLDSKLEEDYISDVQKLAREGFEREFSTSAVIEFCVRAEPSRAKERAQIGRAHV